MIMMICETCGEPKPFSARKYCDLCKNIKYTRSVGDKIECVKCGKSMLFRGGKHKYCEDCK